MPENVLYHADNLDILHQHIAAESIDLIYLDPPYNSGRDYFMAKGATQNGKAFADIWRWDDAAEQVYTAIISQPSRSAGVLLALAQVIGKSDTLAYLLMLLPRLTEMRRVLKSTGSLYLHCDPTTGHYLKLLLDAVFGAENFQNEIVWCYKTGGATRRRFARKHDTIFFYSKDPLAYTFHPQQEKSYMRHRYGFKKSDFQQDEGGQYSQVIMKDWWEIAAIGSADKQRLGYPTQKPEALLERIIQASTNPGDLVLDPFCGCGTTLAVAQRLGRRWLGIDSSAAAVELTRRRLGLPG